MEAIGAEVSAPPAFGTSAPLNKSPYSRPFISHVPFNTVPSQPSIRRSIWTIVHSNLKSQISNLYFNMVKNSSGFLLHMKYKLHNNI